MRITNVWLNINKIAGILINFLTFFKPKCTMPMILHLYILTAMKKFVSMTDRIV